MQEMVLEDNIREALKLLDPHVDDNSNVRPVKFYEAVEPLLEWLNYLYVSEVTGHADEFLDGLRSSLAETVFCASVGLARLAVFTMRAQIDIVMSWLFFKDHPVEYRRVQRTSDGFMLKRDVIKYLDINEQSFSSKLSLMMKAKTRTETDPYKLLSAHIHSQNHKTLPAVVDFKTVICDSQMSHDLLKMQQEVTEFLEDILISCFGAKWASLPPSVVDRIKARLDGQARGVVFS